ncbi:5'/3'-nucleotidase SurE [Parvibaculum sp.]|jgi:5'-nucleotidase|uniref:5'/3'-nucleotidase SurE n=1 Tax=Parvibaculum sp. TaxID=2024848 RepID=UPI000C4C0F63|nr:5'/3'-nucleotidase SurE [Parvibaculum sp.]HAC59566.1 5'/3'-nucleotidase SurE [Rhodobiaceae bacterium]MAU60382.1 5'/3'-nucleotidase SurE [Parvibaculum sp.]MBO6669250.1 5'/3'-nucleotidase SurE [Parvibaculum sp.]MBO6693359.1 5'/3'-nucleotidase SurE [Parvibaculum sp.]MBO6712984.1 5'/3'-nucleotidase SurE [Parvibaculum sp.]|tara:strand:- start:836 stop:1660 length:825 start_codon:yes stop_codon:yes gene_type:complete
MAKGKSGTGQLRILVTNDDGIHAPGLKVLEKIARKLSKDVWVVAPEEEQSGSAHSLSLANPLRVRKMNAKRYAVRGTPSDCVLMAVRHIMKEDEPDLVLSGVNRGQNIADDVTYSGTIAAAMEGTQLGIPSIALSQAFGFSGQSKVKWATAEHFAPDILKKLIAAGWPEEILININFPDVVPGSVTGIEVTRQGKRDQSLVRVEERIDARNNPYYWLGFERILSNPPQGTDLRAIYEGRISITPLHMDLTHQRTSKALSAALGSLEGPVKRRKP